MFLLFALMFVIAQYMTIEGRVNLHIHRMFIDDPILKTKQISSSFKSKVIFDLIFAGIGMGILLFLTGWSIVLIYMLGIWLKIVFIIVFLILIMEIAGIHLFVPLSTMDTDGIMVGYILSIIGGILGMFGLYRIFLM